jgi:hypothetical protein
MTTATTAAALATQITTQAATATTLKDLSYSAAAVVKLKRQFGETTEIAAAESAVLDRINTLAATITDLNELSYGSAAIQHLDSYYNSAINNFALKMQKTNPESVAFGLDGSTLKNNQDIIVNIAGNPIRINEGEAVSLPSLASASDYKVFALADGTLTAQPFDDVAPADSLEVSGFHAYHTQATINPYSIWDLKWRPKCNNPRAMTLSPDQLTWVDIYLMDVQYALNGYSRGNVKIADGENSASFPIKPTLYGGDGTATYSAFTQYNAIDIATAAGKRLPNLNEAYAFAFGVTEQTSVGADPVNTGYSAGFRSLCGVEQATGCMWQWMNDIAATAGTNWNGATDGRGSVYADNIKAAVFGAPWGAGSYAGSRASYWNYAPSISNYSGLGARAACDHLKLA